jgi:hypothetical protein
VHGLGECVDRFGAHLSVRVREEGGDVLHPLGLLEPPERPHPDCAEKRCGRCGGIEENPEVLSGARPLVFGLEGAQKGLGGPVLPAAIGSASRAEGQAHGE